MQFDIAVPVNAPKDWVFAKAADFAALENIARDYGATLNRHPTASVAMGTVWTAEVSIRGTQRRAETRLVQIAPDVSYALDSQLGGLVAKTTVSCQPGGPTETTLRVVCAMTADSLKGRLLLQTLRLGQGRIEARLRGRLAAYAEVIERGFRDSLADPS